ncbi:MAG: HGGxSTG domain-containing protein [Desulfobulbaceae bacterium]|nr:HGGxSTG domain-containing protein [Desulfobulbaceae bacterium]
MNNNEGMDNRPASWLGFHRCEAIAVTTGQRCKMPADGKKYCGFHDGSNALPPFNREHNDNLRKAWKRRTSSPGTRFPEELKWLICGAKTRKGTPCKQRSLYSNGRCRFHGGLSTGPRTPEGKRKSSQNWMRQARYQNQEKK